MKYLLTLLLALVFVGGLAIDAFAAPPYCSHWDGECFIAGMYYGGNTHWQIECADGYATGGVIGGNEVPAICN